MGGCVLRSAAEVETETETEVEAEGVGVGVACRGSRRRCGVSSRVWREDVTDSAVRSEVAGPWGFLVPKTRGVRLRVDARVTLRVRVDPDPMGLDLGKGGVRGAARFSVWIRWCCAFYFLFFCFLVFVCGYGFLCGGMEGRWGWVCVCTGS